MDCGLVGLLAAGISAGAFAMMEMANHADHGFFASQRMQQGSNAVITGGNWSRNEKGENCGDDAEAKCFEHDTITLLDN